MNTRKKAVDPHIVELLRAIRPRLNEYVFVCIAADRIGKDQPHLNAAANRLIKIIDERLYPNTTVSGWLARQPCVELPGADNPVFDTQMLVYRRRWVDAMIREFSS